MMKPAVSMAILMSAVASGAAAQFIPTIGEEPVYEFCQDRPARPEWIENIEPKEAHYGQLVQMMYRAQSLRAVVESGECSCETRYPSWDDAQVYYYEHYSDLERWEVLERTNEYSRSANEFRRAARPVCEAAGNW